MTIETNLSKEQFIRLSILRHLQRRTFYFYAAVCAILTAFAVVQGPYALLLVAWVPFIIYLLLGVVSAVRAGAAKDNPLFLPTRYEFNKEGVSISNAQGKSNLKWEYFAGWKMMSQCYVLFLTAGPMLAIPQSAVPAAQVAQFRGLLNQHIEQN